MVKCHKIMHLLRQELTSGVTIEVTNPCSLLHIWLYGALAITSNMRGKT